MTGSAGDQYGARDVLPTVFSLEEQLGADWGALYGSAERTATLWNKLDERLK